MQKVRRNLEYVEAIQKEMIDYAISKGLVNNIFYMHLDAKIKDPILKIFYKDKEKQEILFSTVVKEREPSYY